MKKASTFLLVAFLMLATNFSAKAQSTGTVFRDYNGNGTKDANEPLVPGVTVNAYNSAEALVGTSVTSSVGAWSIAPTGGYPIRIEFVLNSATATNCFFNQAFDFSSYSGGTYGTSVRFLTAQTTGLTYAVSYPGEYAVTADPFVATSIYTNGNLATTGAGAPNSGNRLDGIKVKYSLINAISPTPATNNTQITSHADMGSVWGVAYSPQSDRLFYSAVLKRHSGIGPNGAGAIYWTNPNTTSGATLFTTLTASATGTYPYLAAPTGKAATNSIPFTGIVGTNAERGINNAYTPYSSVAASALFPLGNPDSYDAAALAQAGKIGLGGMDMSDDGSKLYVMNLFDRKLYTIQIVNPFSTTPTAGTITSVAIPDPYDATGVKTGFARPWAVKYYRGKIYIGIVNDLTGTATTVLAGTTDLLTGGQTGVPTYTNAAGAIYSIDEGGSTFSLVTNVPLNYVKAGPAGELDDIAEIRNAAGTGAGLFENNAYRYNPWTDNYDVFKQHVTTGNTKLTCPQPILSDIEFDGQNNAIIVGIMDRIGLQTSYRTFAPADLGVGTNPAGTAVANNSNSEVASGDVIKISLSNTTCAVTGQAPNGAPSATAEFYVGESFIAGGGITGTPVHSEIATGGLALLVNSGQVLTNAFDPSTSVNSNGIIALQNVASAAGTPTGATATAAGATPNNGTTSYGANCVDASTRGITPAKGVGMGDLELIRDLAPIEIGNRVWNDANGDGIQNANELGINGVLLEIFVDANSDGVPDGAAIGSTTTSATGDWYFNDTNITGDGDPATAGTQKLAQGVNYIVRLATTGLGNDWDPTANGGAGGPRTGGDLVGYKLTKTDAIGSGAVDFSDNDAASVASIPQLSYKPLVAGATNHNLDFGFTKLASLGNKVWLDEGAGGGTRNNGIQDGTEPGVAGVAVNLYQNGADGLPNTADDVLVASTITDAFGIYNFENLTPTDQTNAATIAATSYFIRVTPPANYSITLQTNTTDDNNTTGASTTGSDVNVLGQSYGINLSAGENNPNIDAGLIFKTAPLTNSIGDKVWFDNGAGPLAGNGVQDAGEPGVAGVTVTLYDAATGNIVAITTTDANGNYLFNNVAANTNFQVGFSAPAGTVLTTGGTLDITNGSTNSDPSPTTGKTTTFSSGPAGTQITGVDAGLKNDPKGAIGDRVWIDLNNNNIQDAGEPGVPGVTVTLYSTTDNVSCNGDDVLVATTTTDANGYYVFPNLDPGKYVVRIGAIAGYTAVTKDVGTDDTKDSDFATSAGCGTDYVSTVKTLLLTGAGVTRDMTVDLGIRNNTAGLGSIGDKVWNDVNKDGLQAGEPGVANVTVRLLDGAGLPVNNPATGKPYVVVTDANGNYKFVGLPVGTYTVEFANLPAGFVFTGQDKDPAGVGAPGGASDTDTDSDVKTTTGRTATITLGAGQNIVNVDAGITQGTPAGTASLGNRVWYDTNNFGIQDAGELGVNNVKVELLDGAGASIDPDGAGPLTQTIAYTNALGEYLFTGLPAGDYRVRFSGLPAGFTYSAADQGTDDAKDSDGLATGTTTATTSTTATYTLQTGEDNLTVDLGIVPPPATGGAANAANNRIGDFVWSDLNADGRQQIGTEPGVQGVTVTLYTNGADGLPGTADDVRVGVTTTDNNGAYSFVGLPDGNYNVGFTNLPAGFSFTDKDKAGSTATDGSDANTASGRTGTYALDPTSASGTAVNIPDVDGGIISTRAALGNFVWLDTNGNGVQDATEKGVSGVTVTLYATDGTTVLASTITDADGKYFFGNLTPGDYRVGFSTIPSNLSFTQQNGAGDNQDNTNSDAVPATPTAITALTGVINLVAGETDLTVDAGLKPNNPASVGDLVWNDLNGNGVQDANEPGVPGIIVTLYDAANNVVGTAVTDGNGNYLISKIPAGTGYYIIFSNLPASAIFTTQNSDVTPGDVTNGSDAGAVAGPNFGRTAPFNLTAGQYLPTVDAGIRNVQLLPLKVESFTALPKGSQVNLQWMVSEQINVASYEVLFSTDGRTFTTTIATVAANTNSNATYDAVHTTPIAGINYYRIKSIDKDGTVSYSDIRKVTFGKGGTVSVYPNPAVDIVNISLTGTMVNKVTTVSILSMDGKVLSQQRITNTGQTETINVSTLANGSYIVRLVTENEVVNKTIVVAR
jgi:SdrD B-like domain/Secretion system C-terminal sorting domain